MPHLSYIGDTTMGSGVNVGAGSITCNYDGVHKHKTVIGKDAFIGSDTMMVAPAQIGDGALWPPAPSSPSRSRPTHLAWVVPAR
ncbi:MAG: hypothetical protein ACLU37_04970 [Collinsella sp.]